MVLLPESIQFLAELLLAESLFVHHLKRRSPFSLRLALSIVVLVLFSISWPTHWDGFIKIFKFLITFFLSTVVLWQLFEVNPWEAVFISTAAYAVQHIAFNLAAPVYLFSRFPPTQAGRIAFAACILVIYTLVYVISYGCIGKKMLLWEIRAKQNHMLILFVITMLILVVVLNYSRIASGGDNLPYVSLTITGYSLIGSVFALFTQFFLTQKLALQHRLEISEQLLHSQKEQFHVSKETIECINVKCHDLKYRLNALQKNMTAPASAEALKDIEDDVMIYDSFMQTGNEALDVILTEKSLICEKNGIQLTCMADGSALQQISLTDLYVIFGNLLDNAIESVRQLPGPEHRVIGLTIQNMGNLVLIHAENYFNHPIHMENGIPVTTKAVPRFHGFGIRSMQLLAEKYGGTLSIRIDDNIFNLNILLPVVDAVSL